MKRGENSFVVLDIDAARGESALRMLGTRIIDSKESDESVASLDAVDLERSEGGGPIAADAVSCGTVAPECDVFETVDQHVAAKYRE